MINSEKIGQIISKFETLDPIMVVGDIGIDKYTKGEVSRISPEAPVPVVEVFEEWTKLGLAANVSDNLQSLKVKSTLCGIVGEDRNANTLESLLEESGLSTWGILHDESRQTTFKERVVTGVQQVCRVDYESKGPVSPETSNRFVKRVSELIDSHGLVVLEDYGKGVFTDSLTKELITLSKQHDKFVAVDPSRYTPPERYIGADLLKPNKIESELMVKALGYLETDTEKIAEILVEKLKLNNLIITLGSEGMAIIDVKANNGVKYIPTVAREVFDVSGAGDTAISAIAASLAAGATLEEACWVGNCASGVVVGKKGTALVTQEELKAFHQDLANSKL